MLYRRSLHGAAFETGWALVKKAKVSVQEKDENVDCLTAKKRVKKCDAKCMLGLAAPQTRKGHEVCKVEYIKWSMQRAEQKVGSRRA